MTTPKPDPKPPVPQPAPAQPEPPKPVQFVAQRVCFDPVSFFTPEFPRCNFQDPRKARDLIGPYTVHAEFYDAQFQKVRTADKLGRYGAVVEIRHGAGRPSRRFVTLCRVKATHGSLAKTAGIDAHILADHADEMKHLSDRVDEINSLPGGAGAADKDSLEAVLLAGLHDLTLLGGASKPLPAESLSRMDRQWWVDFKRRYYGLDKVYRNQFLCPTPLMGKPAAVVHEGTLADAGMKPDAVKTIDAACESWVKDRGFGFNMCVVRHGVIVLNRGYGTKAYGPEKDDPYTPTTRGPLASTTKCLSSILLAEMADQGLIGLDDPVDKYVPVLRGIPVKRPLTIRDLYLHVGGFSGHWGDLMPDLEERVADLYPSLEVGVRHEYQGVGYALGGKIMEMITGESIPRMYRKHLFDPLGCADTDAEFTYAASMSTPLDLARIGQMMLNGGSYGDKKFFSPRTQEKMMPIPGKDRFDPPDKTVRWGIGIKQFDIDGLSERAYGHPGASGSFLVVDPNYDLVVAHTRYDEGDRFVVFLQKKSLIFKAILNSMEP
jgi:CubicO group peptidase (beta-lactamase class C family)